MSSSAAEDVDVAIIGAGFSGLYALHRLRSLGFRAQVLEAGGGLGGVWYWNRYPGARCDIQSMEYSYQFDPELAQEWKWSMKFSPQAEILKYLQHVADRYSLHEHIEYNTKVVQAKYEEDAAHWTLSTESGRKVRAQYCIMAVGSLSSPNYPSIPGLADFQGDVYHTGHWPHEPVDFSSKRVGIIGTGSSGIQTLTDLKNKAKELKVFQRTPAWVMPSHNKPLSDEEANEIKGQYGELRAAAKLTANGWFPGPYGLGTKSALEVTPEERQAEYERRWAHGGLPFPDGFTDISTNAEANDTASEFVRAKIREAVKDPATAELLCPQYPIGCKRLCVAHGYYEAFNLPNVKLVDTKDGIEKVTSTGVKVNGGDEHEIDSLILATGYDAFTGCVLKIDVQGKDGALLKDKWADGARCYLGLGMTGFPNLFLVTGPASPSVLTNVVPAIEQHIEFISGLLEHARSKRGDVIEVEAGAEDDWMEHHISLSTGFLRSGVRNWWNGGNIEGKTQFPLPYMGGVANFGKKCEEIIERGYQGFRIDSRADDVETDVDKTSLGSMGAPGFVQPEQEQARARL